MELQLFKIEIRSKGKKPALDESTTDSTFDLDNLRSVGEEFKPEKLAAVLPIRSLEVSQLKKSVAVCVTAESAFCRKLKVKKIIFNGFAQRGVVLWISVFKALLKPLMTVPKGGDIITSFCRDLTDREVLICFGRNRKRRHFAHK